MSLLAVLVLPTLAAAHPLGNFTINHYAGVVVERDRILLDVVIDQAEIPAFQARQALDSDGDGELSAEEAGAGRVAACSDLAGSLDLRVNGVSQALEVTETSLAFPAGAGGLSTMRSTCGFETSLEASLTPGSTVAFADRSFGERLGWREIVVQGSGVTLAPALPEGTVRTSSPSKRLTEYPTSLLTQAPADFEVELVATPGGPVLSPRDLPDAGTVASTVGVAVVPGSITAGDLPAIFRAADLTPLVLLLSVLTAAALGVGHALTPGHGKTLMAAYLVGTRGTPIHAAGLGLSVAVSHTLGILALAGLVVGAQGVLPPEVVVRTAPFVAAVSILTIGAWMLLGEARRRRLSRTAAAEPGHDHTHPHDHGHPHSHGRLRHSHLPTPGSTISRRSLFVLGLAGGLIPSASALLILLGSIAAGRPAFGFVLVVAFGLGMAVVMGGIGLALVVARGRLDAVDASTRLGRAGGYLPLVASFLVLGFGLYLTYQAISGNAVL
jgi:ABC-type nickel/cobalt efflux system permease component RcnA